jgi:hypothetical protein
VVDSMRRFAESESVESVLVGQVIDPERHFSHSMVVTVRDLEALRAYHHDPIHLAADHQGLPLLEDVAAFDVSDDWDSSLWQRITDIVSSRMADQPDIAALVEKLKPGGDPSE